MARRRASRSLWRWLLMIGTVVFFCGALGAVLLPRLGRPDAGAGPTLSGSPWIGGWAFTCSCAGTTCNSPPATIPPR
jgi:hypothetical protein